METQSFVKAKADYNDAADHFGEQPRPCVSRARIVV
jgi:hypothetical protein